jgi:signal transduction histidine kinase
MAGRGLGVGLRGIQERLLQFGGSLNVESANGLGTTVTAVLPLSRVVPETDEGSAKKRVKQHKEGHR